MSSLRLTPEQLADYRRRHGRTNTNPPPPAGKKPKLRLNRERDDTVAEYLAQLQLAGLDLPQFEYRFHDTRRWRADFAWPELGILAEYEGGVYSGGAHTRGRHYESDCEKYNEAALAGFVVLRFTVNMVRSGLALQQTERALMGKSTEK